VVHGNVGLTTPALVFLLRNGARISFVSLDGNLHGSAAATSLPSPERILAQMRCAQTDCGLDLARRIVAAKATSQREHLRRKGALQEDLRALDAFWEGLDEATDLDAVRGVEGMLSRLYFRTLGRLHPELGFEKRLRRPPRDPVNAALSYGYAILLANVEAALLAAELHPEIGVLHATGRRRPALALDLMEEFRVAVVDIPVFSGFLRGVLGRGSVSLHDGAVLLNDRGRKALIELIETRLNQKAPVKGAGTYLTLIFDQAERLAAALVRGADYVPFSLPRR
jgi:CRISPR-associated protein Cas1